MNKKKIRGVVLIVVCVVLACVMLVLAIPKQHGNYFDHQVERELTPEYLAKYYPYVDPRDYGHVTISSQGDIMYDGNWDPFAHDYMKTED